MLQDHRSIMLANEGYFVVEVGYNCQKYGQKSIWTMPEYPVEYFESVIQKALKHPRKIAQHWSTFTGIVVDLLRYCTLVQL